MKRNIFKHLIYSILVIKSIRDLLEVSQLCNLTFLIETIKAVMWMRLKWNSVTN